MSKIFSPYMLAAEIDSHFIEVGDGALNTNDYWHLIETLQETGCEKNQLACAKLFKRLSKQEVIRRSNIVSRLADILTTIRNNKHTNNDLPSPPQSQ